jgi:hypothetical protein
MGRNAAALLQKSKRRLPIAQLRLRNRQPPCRLVDMADKKEQQINWQAALWAIGRVLSTEFECKDAEVPDRIRELLAELEAKGNSDKEK